MLLRLLQTINACVTDYALFVLLAGVGLWYSFQTRFVQARCLREGTRRLRRGLYTRRRTPEQGATSFYALCTAMASQVGVGTIIGGSAAILTGGPGAVFWLWIFGFFGMAVAYAEAALAVQSRKKAHENRYQGGPVYYILDAFDGPAGEALAAWFAVAAVLSLGFVGAAVQSNAISATFRTAFGVPGWVSGLLLSALCAAVLLGRVSVLKDAVERAAPFAGLLFFLGGLVVLLARIAYLPAAVWMIFQYAFTPGAIIGGGYGAAIKIAVSQGAKRGLFVHEAGLGSAPHAHAQAHVDKPHTQGVVAMTGVFLDTFVFLTFHALIILSTLYVSGGPLEHGYDRAALDTLNRTNLTQTAFGAVFGGGVGGVFVAVCLFFFAFSAILNWNLFGRVNMVYLFGRDSNLIYTLAALVFVFLGALTSSDLVWELADLSHLLMAIPNAAALVSLTGMVLKSIRQAETRRRFRRAPPS